jgi:tetratricopeptide (TPR) repeat protein
MKAEEAFLKGKPQEAIGLLARVLEGEPDNVRALSNIGVIFHSAGQYQDARTALEKVLELEPSNNDMRKNLVITLLTLKDFQGARSHLEKLLAVNQNEPQLWALMGRVEASLNNTGPAIAAVERSLLLNPEQPDLTQFLNTLKDKGSGQPGASRGSGARKRNLFVFSAPGKESETDALSEGLRDAFKLERVASVKLEQYLKSIQYADIIWLDGLSHASIYFLNEMKTIKDKKVFMRFTRDDMQKPELTKTPYDCVSNFSFESFYYRDLFLALATNIKPGTPLHVIRRCVDLRTYGYSERTGTNSLCAVLSPYVNSGEIMLMLEAFLLVLKECPEAELHVRSAADLTKEKYIRHFLAINAIDKKVLFHTDAEGLKPFLNRFDCLLSTEIMPGAFGLMEALVMGLKPLIRFSLGQNEYTPDETMWKSFSELPVLYRDYPDPKTTSEMISGNNSPEKIVEFFVKALSMAGPGA